MLREERVSILRDALCPVNEDDASTLCRYCIGLDKCRISQKTDEQLDYVFSPNDESIFLKACPGSGKTEVIALKAAYEIDHWTGLGGLAILTFTNNAANVIAERISQFTSADKIDYPHFVGTFDRWIHRYLANPFSHLVTGYGGTNGDRSIRLVDEHDTPTSKSDSSLAFLNGFKLNTPYVFQSNQAHPLFANNIRWVGDWEILSPGLSRAEFVSLQDYFNSAPFSDYRAQTDKNGRSRHWITEQSLKDDFSESKRKFYRSGFATYSDVELLVLKLLIEKPALTQRVSKRFPVLVVDECQDLSPIQLKILRKLKKCGVSIHLVGDLNQAIYEFKKVDPTQVSGFVTELELQPKELTGNFRSCQPIIDLADRLVQADGKQVAYTPTKLKHSCIVVSYNPKTNMFKLPAWFEECVKNASLSLENSKIIARGWSTISAIRPTGRQSISRYQMWLVTAIYLWRKVDHQTRPEAISLMGKFIARSYFKNSPTRSGDQYRPDGIDNAVEWRLFLARVLDGCLKHSKICNLNLTWTEWAASVRDNFGEILRNCIVQLQSTSQDFLDDLQNDSITFQALSKKGGDHVCSSIDLPSTPAASLTISTIHSVKGETLDAVMVVSSKSRSGSSDGHWEDWIKNSNAEAARMGYVASTRPSHLLVWAIPNVKPEHHTTLKGLGFQQIYSLDE